MNKEQEIRELLTAEMPNEPRKNLEAAREIAPAKVLGALEPEKEGEETEVTEETEATETIEATEETETEEVIDPDIVTIKSLAADLEIEPETLYGMKIPVEGYEPLTISELKDLAQGTMEKREDTKEAENELASQRTEIEKQQHALQAQADSISPPELIKAEADITLIESEYNMTDWPKLETSNPGEAALRRQKLTEAYQLAVYNRDQINTRMETARNEIITQREQAFTAQRAKALETMHSLIPAWRDETVFVKDTEHMINSLGEAGVDEAAIREIKSPSLIKYLYDSVSRDKKVKAAKPIVKAPKVLKAAAVRQSGIGKDKADKRYFENAAQSKDARVKQSAITRLIGG